MELLELPFEAIALRFHSLPAAATWLAVAAAAVGLWRIRAVASRSDAASSSSPPLAPSAPSPEPNPPVRDDPAPIPSRSRAEPSRSGAAPKERFTAYYGGDAIEDDDEVEEEEHVGGGGVDGGVTAPLAGEEGFGWGVNGDLGWYRYQDLTVINGSVVRLWDGDGELTAPSTPRRRWRGKTGIYNSF